MLTELCSKYGELFELWFDAGNLTPSEGGPDFLPIVNHFQPNTIYYKSNQRRDHRWCGLSDQGRVGENCWSRIDDPDYSDLDNKTLTQMLVNGLEDGTYWSPAFSGLPLCAQWFWRPGDEFAQTQKDARRLLQVYYDTVGHNGNLVFGATPDKHGLIPEWQEKVLQEFGQKRKSWYENSFLKTNGNKTKLILEPELPTRLNYAIIQEDTQNGERVREWELLGETNEGNIMLKKGNCIGQKRIVHFNPQRWGVKYIE
jgi:alpha-L-fucosidase